MRSKSVSLVLIKTYGEILISAFLFQFGSYIWFFISARDCSVLVHPHSV